MKLPFRSIRNRTLFLVCLVALLPLVLLGPFVVARLRSELTSQVIQNQKNLAESIRQGIASQFRNWMQQLSRLADDPVVQSLESKRFIPLIVQFLDQNPALSNIFIYDAKGHLIELAHRNRYRDEAARAAPDLFATADDQLKPLRDVFSDVVYSGEPRICGGIARLRMRDLLLVLVPIRAFEDPSRVIGVLSCGIRVDGVTLSEMIDEFQVGESGFLLMTDPRGGILAAKGKLLPEGLESARLSSPPVGLECASTWTTLNEREFLVTVAKVQGVDGFVFIGAPRDEVLGFIVQLLEGMAVLGLISLLLAALIGIVLSQYLIDPILALVQGIRKVADGVVSHRVPVAPGDEDELAEAGKAFNEMASQLEKNRLIEEIWTRTWKS